jgi:glycosyltransferase involved in cell wall biosynthesis
MDWHSNRAMQPLHCRGALAGGQASVAVDALAPNAIYLQPAVFLAAMGDPRVLRMDATFSRQGHPRVVLVHDWLTGMRGGEKCLEALARRWPEARLFTLLHRRGSVSPAIESLSPHTSFLNLLPGAHRYYRYLLPLMPAAVASWRLPPADLVVSFSHCVAKAARPALNSSGPTPHVCYCFTPMRYVWHLRNAYFDGRVRGLSARLLDRVLDALRDWDRRTAAGVSHFIAISRTVAHRIRECYGRESTIIYPPVDTDFYTPAAASREDFYLAVSAFAPYKRLNLALSACRKLGRRLVVIGTGQDSARLRALAGPDVQFLGWQPDDVVRDHLRRCRALIFPGEEDFGIVPVEAMATGAPVIALGQGGVTETVVPIDAPRGKDPTGVWFSEQTVDCLADAIVSFERHRGAFDPAASRQQALVFTSKRFEREFFAFLDGLLEPRMASMQWAA